MPLYSPRILGLLNGYSSRMSGGDQQFIKLINHLAEATPVGLCLPARVYHSDFSEQVTRREYFNPVWFEYLYRSNFSLFFLYLFRILRSYFDLVFLPADIIITSSHLFFDIVPLLLLPGRRLMFTSVYHLISEQDRQGWHQLITTILEKISLAIIRWRRIYIFTSSPLVSEILVNKFHLDPNRILPIRIGLDLKLIRRTKPVRTKFDLVYCGRLHHRKGIYTLLSIIKQLKKKNPRLKMAIIGDGPEKYDLLAEIKRQKLKPFIKIFGHVSDRQKYSLIKSSRVFLLPSFEEGWGIVIAESLACRTPVVVSSLPDIKPIWKNNVIWANQLNPESFVWAAHRLLTDSQYRARLTSLGYRFVQKLDWKIVLSKQSQQIIRLWRSW